MRTEEQIHYRLKEYQARANELQDRIITAGWDRSTEYLQTDLDQYNMLIGLLKWILQ